MSQVLNFYKLESRDSEGRMLSEIWEWDDQELEECHDFIQWMFPLNEASAFNPDAPLVTREDQRAFWEQSELRAALRRSLAVFLAFLGLLLTGDGRVVRGENFEKRLALWKHGNHNWLRITRVLKSLRLLGLKKEAQALWDCLQDLHKRSGLVSGESFNYWRDAVEG